MNIKLRKSLSALAIGGAASIAMLTAAPTSAVAEAAKAQGNTPACVAIWQKSGWVKKTGYARNDCGRRMRYRIDWSYGADGRCFTVDPGQTISSTVPKAPRKFNGASYC
ncbi:hypothetical protein AB0K16_14530 [Nonomuraea jabiensis]|uniref:Alpha amylase inhibitor n=1 Tax=Nonomuraea jabiensis TaxID=882448 RepID=A0A7W9G6U2_9ACTN|nr:hypothetical protein [Nonomuraea jabiensis]MBB5778248.1 hypothetical protein [Nonomuraea jabiensis]